MASLFFLFFFLLLFCYAGRSMFRADRCTFGGGVVSQMWPQGGFDGVMIDGYLTNCRSTAGAVVNAGNDGGDGGNSGSGSPRIPRGASGITAGAGSHACPHISGMNNTESHTYLRVLFDLE